MWCFFGPVLRVGLVLLIAQQSAVAQNVGEPAEGSGGLPSRIPVWDDLYCSARATEILGAPPEPTAPTEEYSMFAQYFCELRTNCLISRLGALLAAPYAECRACVRNSCIRRPRSAEQSFDDAARTISGATVVISLPSLCVTSAIGVCEQYRTDGGD